MPKRLPNPKDIHVGRRVRAARIAIDMSQTTLGDALRLTFQQIQKYERGTNRIGAGRLHTIAGILGKPVAYFFEGLEGSIASGKLKAIDDPFATLGETRAGHDLARAFNAIPDPKARAAVVTLAEILAGYATLSSTRKAA
jgi:transcriptional regulator with XRE-family HTH domain